MALLPNLALFAWVGVVLVLFGRLPGHRALILAYVIGWLFLPEIHTVATTFGAPTALSLPAFKVTKSAIASLAPLLGVLLFDCRRLLSFRPSWFDLPMAVWCVCPLLSSLANPSPPDGTSPLKDGLSQARAEFLAWGVPYLLGRLYLADLCRFRELVIGLLLGGLAYVPCCLFEVRFSPQLHRWLYGFYQHEFGQSLRGGGYRPTVFLEHGLAVGLWMSVLALLAFWLWWTGAIRQLDRGPGRRPLPMSAIAFVLIGTALLVKSTGALLLGVAGCAVLFAARLPGGWLAMVGLLAIAPLYAGGRVASSEQRTGWLQVDNWYDEKRLEELEERALAKRMFGWAPWSSQQAAGVLTALFSKDRAESFAFRLLNEDKLLEKVHLRPWLGWAGWGRARLYNDDGDDMTVTDGLWIVSLGDRGLVGLLSLGALLLLPAARFLARYPARLWAQPGVAPGAAAAVMLTVYLIDNLTNAMYNPLFLVLAGGLSSLASVCPTTARRPAPVAARPVALPYPRRLHIPARRPGVLCRPRPVV